MTESSVPEIEMPEQHLTVMIHEMSLMVARLFNREVREIGLTRTQWQVLYCLYHDDGRTQTQLAEILSMAKPPVGKIVDRLEADGWVVRKEDPSDRRAKLVYLTSKVQPLISPLENIVTRIGESVTAGMSIRDKQKFTTLVRKACANLAATIGEED